MYDVNLSELFGFYMAEACVYSRKIKFDNYGAKFASISNFVCHGLVNLS